jgi:hypothetical protein
MKPSIDFGEYMAEAENRKGYPMLSPTHWWALRKKFLQSIPGVVTDNYLATVLNMQANSARANVLLFLRTLGIVDQDNKPTERAKLWRDDEHYSEVCAAMVKEVYPEELISAVPDPRLEKEKAKSWFARQAGVGQDASSRMVALYTTLVEADVSKQPDQERKPAAKKASTKAAATASPANTNPKLRSSRQMPRASSKTGSVPSNGADEHVQPKIPELNINLQIHISADASPDQIEQIFASMSKHLYRHGQ